MFKILTFFFIVLSHGLFAQPNLVVKGVSKKCALKLLDKTLVYSALSQTDFENLPLKTVKALRSPYPSSLVENYSSFYSYAQAKIKSHPRTKLVAVSYFFNLGSANTPSASVNFYYLVTPFLFGSCKIDPVNIHEHKY